MLFCEFCEFFRNSFLYRAPPVAASELNLSMFSNQNQNCGSSLCINCINPIGLWCPKLSNKVTASITKNLSIVLELSKNIPKRIYGRKNALVNAYWNVKTKFWFLSNFYIVFDNSSIIFKLLIVLQISMYVIVDLK